jgi:phosphate/sulfate permease
MTRGMVAEKLMWLTLIVGIGVGWTQGWNPVATAIGLLVVVAATYHWSHR